MIRAHRLVSEGDAALIARLPHGDRHRRRLVVNTEGGERVLIDLAAATALRHGDRLAMEDGRVLRIEAAEEAVADITAADATLLSRLAWHLGNRHTPTAVMADRLRIRRDHVLEAMVTRLGGTVTHRDAPFDPEVGAYHDGGHHHP
ncbi:urease accessory protein UreE [Acuticoccus sp.]|uniref:urease accessory protein UreE n=1 Tax=Acuticoccus sp. TaxID=1904378 RepID=UPI003B517D14